MDKEVLTGDEARNYQYSYNTHLLKLVAEDASTVFYTNKDYEYSVEQHVAIQNVISSSNKTKVVLGISYEIQDDSIEKEWNSFVERKVSKYKQFEELVYWLGGTENIRKR